MRTLNVVHIISALPVGGVERNLLRLLPQLQGDAFRVQVACTRERGDLADPLEKAGIPVTLIPLRTRYDPGSLRRFARWLREQQTDIVQCHMRRANTSGRIAAILAGVPIRIASERNMGTEKSWRHYLVDRLLARWSDAIVGVTRAVCEENSRRTGIAIERYRTIHTGIDLERFADMPDRNEARTALGLPADKPVLGFVGRLHPIKNIPAILTALAQPETKHVHLALVGDGREELRAEYEALAKRLGLSERVVFTGFRDDLPTVYAALDGLVLASHSEGIANAQMEALAAGVPLVSTRIGFAAEVLTPGDDYALAASDAPQDLAGAIASALEGRNANRLAKRGRELMQDYSIQRQAERTADLYAELARRHGLDAD